MECEVVIVLLLKDFARHFPPVASIVNICYHTTRRD